MRYQKSVIRNDKNRKTLGLSVIGVILLITIVVLFYPETHSKTKILRFGITPYQDTALLYVAYEMGWFDESGLNIQFVPLAWGDVISSLAGGAIDASIYTFNSFQAPYEAAVEGSRKPVYYCPIYVFKGVAIMVHEESNILPFSSLEGEDPNSRKARMIKSIGQLRGKRIAATKGTEFEQIILRALALAGLDPDRDVTMIHATPDNALAAFIANDVDAFGAGLTERIAAKKTGGVEFLVASDLGYPSIDGIVTTEDFARNNSHQLNLLINIWYRTIEYVKEDVQENSFYVREYLKNKSSTRYTPEEYALAWSFNEFPTSAEESIALFEEENSPYYWKRKWDDNNEFLLSEGLIKNPIPYTAYWGTEVLKQLQTP